MTYVTVRVAVVLVAASLILIQSVSAQCETTVPLTCAFEAEDAQEPDTFCDSETAPAAGTATTNLDFTPIDNTTGRCAVQTEYTAVLPTAVRTTARFIVTALSFEPLTPEGTDDATIEILLGAANTPVTIGRFAAGRNAVVMPNLNAIRPSTESTFTPLPVQTDLGEFTAPFNGRAFCNNTFSYQVWDVSSYRAASINSVRIRNPSSRLRAHSIVANTCADRFPTASRTTEYTRLADAYVTVDRTVASMIAGTSTTPTAVACQVQCRTTLSCIAFVWTGTCTLVSSLSALRYSSASAVLGIKPPSKPLPYTDELVTAVTTFDASKLYKPGSYPINIFDTVVLPRFDSESDHLHHFQFTALDRFALGAAQTNLGTAFAVAMTNGSMRICGKQTYPFIGGTAANGTCDSVRYCPLQQHPGGGATSVVVSMPVLAVEATNKSCAASELRSLAVFHYQGSLVAGPRYSYAHIDTESVGVTAATPLLAEKHAEAITSIASVATGSSLLQAYKYFTTTVAAEGTTAPAWRWTDADGGLRSTSLWCDVRGPIGYSVVHNNGGDAAGDKNCGLYSTIGAITEACERDAACVGFSMQSNTTHDIPRCLKTSTTLAVSNSTVDTMYLKTMDSTVPLTCTFPVQRSPAVTIRITNGLPSANVTISADGVEVGQCVTTDVSFTAGSSCGSVATCYAGAIPTTATSLTVTFRAVAPYRRRCPTAIASVVATFSPNVPFSSPSGCITSTSLASATGCFVSTGPMATCATDAYPEVALTTSGSAVSFCEISESTPTSAAALVVPSGLQATTQAVIVALDLSGLSSGVTRSLFAEVYVRSVAGTEHRLGFAYSGSDLSEVHFAPLGVAGRLSASRCVDSSVRLTSPGGGFQVFPVSRPLMTAGIASVSIRGAGVRVLFVGFQSSTCEAFPLPQNASVDSAFSNPVPGLSFTAAALSTSTVTNVGDCATACGVDPRCLSWSAAAATVNGSTSMQCQLQQGVRGVTIATPGTAAAGFKAVAKAPRTFPAPNDVSTLHAFLRVTGITSAATFSYSLAAVTSARVGFGNSRTIRVALVDGGLTVASGINLASNAGSRACGRGFYTLRQLATTVACTTYTSCNPISAAASTSGVLTVAPSALTLPATTCNGTVSGVVATDGSVAGHISYMRGEFFSDVTTTIDAAFPSADSRRLSADLEPVILDDLAGKLGLFHDSTDGDSTATPTLSSTRTSAVCEVHSANSYSVHSGRSGPVAAQYDCASVRTIQEAMTKCSSDTNCRGFTSSSTDRLVCFFNSEGNITNAAENLFIRRNVIQCRVKLSSPGNLAVRMTQVGLGRGESEATVRVNSRMMRACGGTVPFSSGFSSATQACDIFRTCVDDIVTDTTSEVVVTLPTISRGACPNAARVVFTFTPAQAASLPFYSALAALPHSRPVRVSGTANGVGVTLAANQATRVGILVQQDRYSCLGACSQTFAINVSLGDQVIARCGGVSGFAEFRGLTDACGTYLYCGTFSGTLSAPTPSVFTAANTISVNIVQPSLYVATNCGSSGDFRVRVFSNGGLTSAASGVSETRVLYGLVVPRDEIGATGEELSFMTESRRFTLLKETYEEFDNATYVEKLFQVKQDNDQLPSFGFLGFDVPTLAESSKVFGVGDWALCHIDQLVERTVYPRCRINFSGRSIKVLVAQTSFAAFNQIVTISMGGRSFLCGGDNLFFGFQGVNGRCDTYYKCYEGVSFGSEVVVTFASQIDGSTCSDRALAAVQITDQAAPQSVVCTDAQPFTCVPQGSCLSLDQVCDGTVDCTDGTDEGSCTNWNYVLPGVEPSCDTSPPTLTTTSLAVCQRYAVSKGARTLVLTDTACKVYDCLNFDSPLLTSVAGSGGNNSVNARMYIQASDPTAFKLCSDALHCNNNGRVLSVTSPCQCACDVQYIGDRCESIRDISLIESVFVVYPAGMVLNSTHLASTLQAVQSRVLDPNTVVTIAAIRTSPLSTAVELSIVNSLTGVASQDVRTVLSQPVAAAIIADIEQFGAIKITATSVVGNDISVSCNFANLTGTNECARVVNINETQSVSVTVPAITLSTEDQWVRIELTSFDGVETVLTCNGSDFVRTVNPLLDGTCSVSSTCLKILDRVGAINMNVVVSPGINPNQQRCSAGRIFESTIQVSGYVTLPDAQVDTESISETSFNGSLLLLSILLFVLGGLALIHFIVWFVWMRKHFSSVKYLGPIASTLSFFLLVGGAIAYGLYLDSAEGSFTHMLLIEEYRDDQCADSEFAFIPSRASYVAVTEACRQLNVIGEAQGVEYFAVRIPNGTNDRVEVRRGGTIDTCSSARWQTFSFRTCVSQAPLFVNKPVPDQLFMQMISLPEELVLQRVNAIRDFNPPTVLTQSVTIGEVPLNERIDFTPGAKRYTAADLLTQQMYPQLPAKATEATHYLVKRTSDLTTAVANNASNDLRVRFVETFNTGRTLFSEPKTIRYNSPPFLSTFQTVPKQFEDVGTHFNGFRGASALSVYSGTEAYRTAHKYQDVRGSDVDLGTKTQDFTMSFWVRASRESRGIAFAVTDNWVGVTGAIPTIDRLIAILENGPETTSWYNNDADVYASVFVNGFTNSISFVHTINGEFEVIDWDLSFIGAERLFDNEWHFVAFQFFFGKSNQEVQLIVDGQTSFTQEGWRHCLRRELRPIKDRTVGDTMLIFNPRDETVRSGGLMVLGHANIGMYDFSIHDSALLVEELVRLGAEGMDEYATVARGESVMLGVCLALLGVGMCLAMIYEVWFHFFGVSTDVIIDQNKQRTDDAPRKTQTQGGLHASGSAGGSTRGELLLQFINPVIGVSQSMALYLDAWRWPDQFVEWYGQLYSALSLDLFDVVPDMPVLLAPAVQFALAIIALFAIAILAVRDEEVYAQVLQSYRDRTRSADRAFTRRLELERPKPEYNWVYYDEDDDRQPLESNQEDFLLRSLHDLLTSSHRKAKNMRLHSSTILKFPGFGSGILLYERREGDIGVFFRVSHDQGLSEVDINDNVEVQQSDRIRMTQITFECVSPSNVVCPLHERRLLKSDMEGISCVHNESTYYRSVSCDPAAVMYQCPEDDCMYAVCEDCWTHGAGAADSALTGALSTLAEVKRKGLWKAMSTLVIVVALVMYLPVTKNAMLILTCHPSFQCEFGACWSDPDMKYLISAMLSIITVVFIGVGLIVMQSALLYRRQTSLLHELPVKQVLRKCNIPCRSNFIVMREDYDEFLDVDESMLKALYSVYDFQHLLFGPMYLLYKAAIIIGVVGTTPRSLTQLTTVSLIEAVFAIVLTARSPYKNVFIEAIGRFSSLHQVVMLSLTSLHRVDIADGKEGYGDQMILAVLVYFGAVILVGIGIIISPWLRRICMRDSVEEQLEKELAEEDEKREKDKEERKRVHEQKLEQQYKDNAEGDASK